MSCRRTRKLLPLHAGGDLEPEVAGRVEAHTASCAECARERARYQTAREQLLLLQGEPVTVGGLWESLHPRLAAVDVAAQRRQPWYRRPSFLSAAAAVLLASVAVPVFLDRGPQDAPAPASPLGGLDVGLQAWESRLIPVPASEFEDFLRGSFPVRNNPVTGTPAIQAGNRGEF